MYDGDDGKIHLDKGVPSPDRHQRSKYPWDDMEVGDSFFAPGTKASSLNGAISMRRPKKFTRRTLVENGVKGIRVWRVE